MPTLDEIYGVPVRTPIRMNLDAYAQAFNKIDQRDLQAREIKSKINAGLSEIKAKLNVADYDWFDQYTDNINREIEKEASFGNYANALNKATELAGTFAGDSELLSRIKANQDYEIKRKEIEARANSGDISQITANRWIKENPYSFDKNTMSLSQYRDPVARVDYTKMFNQVNALTLAQTNQGNAINYIDKDGNLTEDFTKAYSLLDTTQRTQFRSRKSLQNVFNTIMNNYPDAYASLMQDFADMKWEVEQYDEKINNTTNQTEKDFLIKKRNQIKEAITKNGVYMTPAEYLDSRSKSVLDNLVINDITSDNKLSGLNKP